MSDFATTGYVIAQSADLDFVPFEHPKAGGEPGTDSFGEIAVVRETSSGGGLFVTAFWRTEPAESPLYDAPLGDESGYVIRGSATVHLVETGQEVELRAGDLYSFSKGTLMRWSVHEPFEKFVVVVDS